MRYPNHVLLTASLLALPAFAQESIVPYLPADTIMAFSAPDIGTSLKELSSMPMAKMWAEEEVQKFVADLKDMVKGQIDQGLSQLRELHAQGQFPMDPDDLLKLRVNGATMALTHLEVEHGDFGPMPKIGIMIYLDFGDTAKQWDKVVTTGLDLLTQAAGEKMTRTDAKVGDCAIVSMLSTKANAPKMGLHIATVPHGLLIGTLADEVGDVVQRMQSKKAALGADANYMATTKRLNVDGAECESFLRLDSLVDFGVEVLRMAAENERDLAMVDMDGVERALRAMGLRDLGSTGFTSRYEDGKCIWRTVQNGHGLAGTSAIKSVDMSFLKWVPKDAVSFSASTIDFMSFYGKLVAGLNAYDENMAKQVFEQQAELEKQLGFNIRDELFGAFGDHMISWSMPWSTPTSPPETAFLIKVTDEAKLVHVIKSLCALSDGHVELEESEKRGLKVYTLHLNVEEMRGMNGINPFEMFVPTFSFKNGYLVGAFSASDIKRTFQRMDREDDPKGDIRSNKEFATLADRLPKTMQSVSFTDWKTQFESLYQIATGLLAFLPMGEDVPIDMALLPDSATLTRHLFGEISYGTANATGSESVTISPFGPEFPALIFGVVAAAAGTVTAMRGRGF